MKVTQEEITVAILGLVMLSSIFFLPPETAEKIVLSLGGALGGYLTGRATEPKLQP